MNIILSHLRSIIWKLRKPQPVRRLLPERRHSETFDLDFGGFAKAHTITVGYYPDGEVGEVFIDGGKVGEHIEAIARDSAMILSLALQYGVPLETIARALTRDDRNLPTTILCTVVDILAKVPVQARDVLEIAREQ